MKETTSKKVAKLLGSNLRRFRKEKGYSAQTLGSLLPDPITFQQIQKYESGMNRVSAASLYFFARILGKGVEDFYEGIEKIDHTSYYRDAAGKMISGLTEKMRTTDNVSLDTNTTRK